MSHFVGLVITTPDCNLDVDECLDKYWEENEVSEYCVGEVDEFDKLQFILYYSKKYKYNAIVAEWVEKLGIELEEFDNASAYGWRNKDGFVKYVKENYPTLLPQFAKKFKVHGEDWNGNRWRKDGKKWFEYSTYNPDSKWDWWCMGGRWDCALKTKAGEFVNAALLGEIDWSPFTDDDYEKEWKVNDWTGEKYRPLKEDVRWHLTEDKPPFCVIIDGTWYEKGEMGWWGMTSNEKDDNLWESEFKKLIETLPPSSEVVLADFHI